jgi:hypothetical protein
MSARQTTLNAVHRLILIRFKPTKWQSFAENRLMYGEVISVFVGVSETSGCKDFVPEFFSIR